MTSLKIKFRPSSVPGKKGVIYFQIIHNRTVRQVLTPLNIFPDEWDFNENSIKPGIDPSRYPLILSYKEQINTSACRIRRIINSLEASGLPFSATDIISNYKKYLHDFTFFNYSESLIAAKKQNGKIGTAAAYSSALESFRTFRKGDDILLDSINSRIIGDYETFLISRRVTSNTVSFYMRILRAIYNRAVEEGIISQQFPFKKVYTGIGKTVKRALPLKIIRSIKNLDLSDSPHLDYARDMFMLSFYMRGMSVVDMAFLKKKDLKKNHIVYRRRKTGRQLEIEWTREMQQILKKYRENRSDYLLPIITENSTNERLSYRNKALKINYNLKIIARMLKLPWPLTLYVARHSWASVAKSKGIPLQVISEGMGHHSEHTTLIYLASLDQSVIDKANSLIIKSL